MAGINAPKIIGFCGYPGSGKDEAAKVLIARGWQRIAFADKLREMALAIDPFIEPWNDRGRLSDIVREKGWHVAKQYPEVRRLLQRIGTEAVRNIIGPHTWVQIAERQIEVGRRVVFTDVRFANEAEMIRSRGGVICHIVRDSAADKPHNSHSSEQYEFPADCQIWNNGTLEELANQVLELAGYTL